MEWLCTQPHFLSQNLAQKFFFRAQIGLTYPTSSCAQLAYCVRTFPPTPLSSSLHTKPPPHFLSLPRNREGQESIGLLGIRSGLTGQWMPACAGMTMCGDRGPYLRSSRLAVPSPSYQLHRCPLVFRLRTQNLARKFPCRVQIGLTYPGWSCAQLAYCVRTFPPTPLSSSLHTKPPPHFLSLPRNREGQESIGLLGIRSGLTGQWMPACAGMTMCGDRGIPLSDD